MFQCFWYNGPENDLFTARFLKEKMNAELAAARQAARDALVELDLSQSLPEGLGEANAIIINEALQIRSVVLPSLSDYRKALNAD